MSYRRKRPTGVQAARWERFQALGAKPASAAGRNIKAFLEKDPETLSSLMSWQNLPSPSPPSSYKIPLFNFDFFDMALVFHKWHIFYF